MSYKFEIPQSELSSLWKARQFLGKGSIASQVRMAVSTYLDKLEEEIGAPISDIADVIQRHEQEAERK